MLLSIILRRRRRRRDKEEEECTLFFFFLKEALFILVTFKKVHFLNNIFSILKYNLGVTFTILYNHNNNFILTALVF